MLRQLNCLCIDRLGEEIAQCYLPVSTNPPCILTSRLYTSRSFKRTTPVPEESTG